MIRAFLYFFAIFCAVQAIYWLFLGKLPSRHVEALVIVPVALIIAFALANVFNRYRSRVNK